MITINNSKLISLETQNTTNPIITLLLPKDFCITRTDGTSFRMFDYRYEALLTEDNDRSVFDFEADFGDGKKETFAHGGIIAMLRNVSALHLKGVKISNVVAKPYVEGNKVGDYQRLIDQAKTVSAFQHLVEIAFTRGVTVVDYDPSWANNTGHMNGFTDLQFPEGVEEVVFIDNHGRFGYGVKTMFGNVVLFQRYKTETLVVQNQSHVLSSLCIIPNKVVSNETAELVVGCEHYDLPLGKRIDRAISDTVAFS